MGRFVICVGHIGFGGQGIYIAYILTKNGLPERGTYIRNDFRVLDSGCICWKKTEFLWLNYRRV